MIEGRKSNQRRNYRDYLVGYDGRMLSEEDFWLKFLDTLKEVSKGQHLDPRRTEWPWSEIFSRWAADKKRSFSTETEKYVRSKFHFMRRKAKGETGREIRGRTAFATVRMMDSFKMVQDLPREGNPKFGVPSQIPEDRAGFTECEGHSRDRNVKKREKGTEDLQEPCDKLSVPWPSKRQKITLDEACDFMKEQLDELSAMLRESVLPTAYKDARQILASNRSMKSAKNIRFSSAKDGDYDHSLAVADFHVLKTHLSTLVEQKTDTVASKLKKNLHARGSKKS